MKRSLVSIGLLSVLIFLTSYMLLPEPDETKIDAEELATTCKVLKQLTYSSSLKNDVATALVYTKAAEKMIKAHQLTGDCAKYFEGVASYWKTKNVGSYVLSAGQPLKPMPRSTGGGGTTHHSLDLLEVLVEEGWTMDDLNKFKFMQQLENGKVDPELLKKQNPGEILKLDEGIQKLQMQNYNYDQLQKLPNRLIDIEDVKKLINEEE